MTLRQRYEWHDLVLLPDGTSQMKERVWQQVRPSESEKVRLVRARMDASPDSPPIRGPYCERLSKRTHWKIEDRTGRASWRVGPWFTWSDERYEPELYEGE